MAFPSTAFRVRDVAPDDIAWHAAPEPVRRDFWRQVVSFVKEVKDRSLARGLDRHGLRLAPITRYTREHRKSEMGEADPDAPPLTPAHGLSRTRAWLDGRAYADHAEFFWRNGWGKILAYHRAGARNRWAKRGRLPVRDVIGLSQADTNEVRRLALGWWRNRNATTPTARGMRLTVPPPPGRKPAPPVKIVATGTTDLRHMTMHTGEKGRAAARIAAGRSTGFRQFFAPEPKPRGRGTAAAPRPRPRPAAAARAVAAKPRPRA